MLYFFLQAALDYLLWHHFGGFTDERAHDLVNMYKNYFTHDIQVIHSLLISLTCGKNYQRLHFFFLLNFEKK